MMALESGHPTNVRGRNVKHSMPKKICRFMPETPNILPAGGPGLPIEPHFIAHLRRALPVGCPSRQMPAPGAAQMRAT